MRKRKILVMGILFIGLIIFVIGITYAAFVYSREGLTVNTITTGTVTMVYNEGEDYISINNAMPLTEEVGKVLTEKNQVFDFTVNINLSGSNTISYEVTAIKDISSTLGDQDVRLYLEKSIDGIHYNDAVLEPSFYTPIENDDLFGAKKGEMVLDVGSTSETVTYYYRLRMWVDSSYELKDFGKSFTVRVNVYGRDGTYQEKKPSIRAVYQYDDVRCVSGDEDTCVISDCYKNKTVNSCPAGTIVKYAVNDNLEKYFYVLHDDGDVMTLQQRENTVYNVKWHDSINNVGPINALERLEDETSNWSNVNTQTYFMGETPIFGSNYTGCTSYNECLDYTYYMDTRVAKARMITTQEAAELGCSNLSQSCPVWMFNYLQRSVSYGGTVNDTFVTGDGRYNYGYWTMNAYPINDRFAWRIYYSGSLYNINVNVTMFGARAVIEISK